MIRVLFSILAVVVAVLAVVLDQPLLYVVAGVLLLLAVIALLSAMRRRHREAQPLYTKSSPEEELKSLGIMDIRPKDPALKTSREGDGMAVGEARAVAALPPDEEPSPREMPPREMKEYGTGSDDEVDDVPAAPVEVRPVAPAPRDPHNSAVLEPYLQALRAAIGARVVCLLKQEDIQPEYDVVMLVSAERTRRGRTFSAREPLLTAGMTQHPVTVRHVGDGGMPVSSLGYTRTPDTVRQIAVAPVPRQDDIEAYFLVADTAEDDALSDTRCRALLAQFAKLLATLLDTPKSETEETIRPRREIIAEEMVHARNEGYELSMALVYLNRAEAIADEGAAAIRAAERLMETRLHESVEGRIERFGELTYGVFYRGSDVEAWGRTIQHAFLGTSGLLDGGVSIGIALLEPHHESPQAFRQDAMQALSATFESGSCVILE
ncbi:MAG TPA: hypothetical protein VKP65_17215 [Rhodothermales bacterium]|nr:hypothetical protein [Rhodothermales bacterium]